MRLTKPLRLKILQALNERRHEEKRKSLNEREQALALRIYRDHISAANEKKADQLNEDIPGMVPCAGSIYVRTKDGYSSYISLGHARPQPRGQLDVFIKEGEPFYAEAHAVQKDEYDWSAESRQASESAEAALAMFKTVEELAESWAEIMPLAQPVIDVFIADKKSKEELVPALVPAELNAMFALPVEAEQELEAA